MKKTIKIKASHIPFLILSPYTGGKKAREKKSTVGNMARFIKGIRRPLAFVLLSLKEAIMGSDMASVNLLDASTSDIILIAPNNNNCGIRETKPLPAGGR